MNMNVNVKISCSSQGHPKESIELYNNLGNKNINPDGQLLFRVKEVQEDVVMLGFGSDLLSGNSLINLYGKCRSFKDAQKVFDEMPKKDLISWTLLSAFYVNCGLSRKALEIFRDVGLNGMKPNSMTLALILPACLDLKCLSLGREVHGYAIRNGMGDNVFVNSDFVKLYVYILSVPQAECIFANMSRRNTVSWNAMLAMHFSNGKMCEALVFFQRMRNEGRELNIASWNSMIGGCMKNGQKEQVLKLVAQMQNMGFKLNHITIASVLPACTDLEHSRGQKEIHGYFLRHGFIEDKMVTTALLFMYAKCGDSHTSEKVFGNLQSKDTVAWNTMILANSMHGNGEGALLLFNKMIESGVKPNNVTFIGVLSSCSHSRLVNEARHIFKSMKRNYMIEPDTNHYSCMVDVLSRSGRLEKAYNFIQKMLIEPSASVWGALLGACGVYKNINFGRVVAAQLFEIEPDNPGNS